MRNAIALLLTVVACSAQEIYWTLRLTPENGGARTRVTSHLSTFDYQISTAGGTALHRGRYFYAGNSNIGAAFAALPSPSSFSPLVTNIVFTNLNSDQSVTADTLQFFFANDINGVSWAAIGLVSSETMTVADQDIIHVTASNVYTYPYLAFGVFDIPFSQFNVGTWSADRQALIISDTPIPEPSAYGLALGCLALAGTAIRRRRSM